VVLVETVGVGQEEIDVSRLVDTVVLVQVPGVGDEVQLLKAGLLELADVYVVNKADLPGSEDVSRGLRSMVGLTAQGPGEWKPPVLRCSATGGDGFGKLADSLVAHLSYLQEDGRLDRRRLAIAQAEIAYQINADVQRRLALGGGQRGDSDLIEAVARRRLTPFEAARQWLLPDSPGDRSD
jgi:LAO/AO transport system kinase